jgi:hypothetical protein
MATSVAARVRTSGFASSSRWRSPHPASGSSGSHYVLQKADLPTPILNASIELDAITKPELDVLCPDQKLTVELDSRQAHETTRAFEAVRPRDRRLIARGYTVIRITWRQLLQAPHDVVEDIQAALSACRQTAT